MIMFSKNEVDRFRHSNKNLRWGQQFHQEFKLEKVQNTDDKYFCDKLYMAKDEVAKAMVASRLDPCS